jgi:hypothetical protein
MMSMKDNTDRGETHIRSVGFLDECEDALGIIRSAKLRAAHEVQKAMERLRDVLAQQHSRICSASEDSDIQWEADCKVAMEAGELITDEFAYMTEREIRNEMNGE